MIKIINENNNNNNNNNNFKRNQLILFKHKTRQRKWESGELMSGEYTQTTDIDFYLKQVCIKRRNTNI